MSSTCLSCAAWYGLASIQMFHVEQRLRNGKESTMASNANSQQKGKSRLGRGLSSLLSASDLPVVAEVESVAPVASAATLAAAASGEIPVDQITANPHQPRREMNDASLAELAASLKSTGLIQPIIVRQTEHGYQLIAGERRLRAAKLAGLTSIPAIIRSVDNFTQAQMALIENIQREDLNPIDRAQAYRNLADQLGLTQQELATRLGEDRSSIANFLRLLELAEPVRAMVRDRQLSVGHAKLLAAVPDILEQQRLAELCIAQELSVRNLERLLAGEKSEPAVREAAVSSHLADLEKTITRQLGMRVQVRSNRKGRGRLVIQYSTLDQFDELIKRLGVRIE
jgi:ParB family chromosome partitioning protein